MVAAGLARFESARDLMRSRGPDGAGVWDGGHVVLGHRRLAVVDLSSAASQPMASADGRYAIVYNGELYNDAELRRELESDGPFRTGCDTETVLRALIRWGPGGLERLRGMFALAFVDTRAGTVLLARDPLGIKPLHWAEAAGGNEIVFASQPAAVLRHPDLGAAPDPVTVSAYLTTIRTTLGERTLFRGVRVLRPGAWLEIGCGGAELTIRRGEQPLRHGKDDDASEEVRVERVRRVVEDSVRRHLRSDVPVCCLLSGGLDSSIIATVAQRELGRLHTFCSGDPAGEDFAAARLVAERIGSGHVEAPVTRELFAGRWREMIDEMGLPLSTPNEVAINLVARTLRDAGMVVALSGEGADELFAGYEGPMAQAAAFEAGDGRQHPGEFQLAANAWIAPGLKETVLNAPVHRACEGDAALIAEYREEFERVAEGAREPLQAHLNFHRRINLAGLLQRLDTATMLESVEGRTPFADRVVMEAAESLPMSLKFRGAGGDGPAETKIALRRAFADVLPESVVRRPKASFPLPFQGWMADRAGALQESGFAREWFTPAARAMVRADPGRSWGLAWPMLNIAMWGRRWWG
jgi:asparagine synthase (glutamine-hydrolysing)